MTNTRRASPGRTTTPRGSRPAGAGATAVHPSLAAVEARPSGQGQTDGGRRDGGGDGGGDNDNRNEENDGDLEAEALDVVAAAEGAGVDGPAVSALPLSEATLLAPRVGARGRAEEGARGEPAVARDPLTRFMSEVRRFPRLSEDEERTLGRAAREGGDMDAARKLVVHNLRLVVAIAHQYRRAWANILDLFQEGSVGLMEAVKRWEPTLGPRFGSYAAYWIRAYVLKFLMTNSRLIHVGNTRAGRKLFFRLERERQKLLVAGFEPTPKLLAAKLDVAESDLDEVGRHLDSREVSFDPSPAAGGDLDEGYSLSERIPLAQASPEDSAATAEMSGALHAVMDEFLTGLTDERERAIWSEHLAATEPVHLGEIGARFGVSKQRMGQLADKLKKRFREQVVARMGPEIQTDWLGGED